MRRKHHFLGALALLVLAATSLVAQDYYRRTDIFQLVNGLVVGETKLSAVSTPSAGIVQIGGTDVTSLTRLVTGSAFTQDANGVRMTPQTTQVIGAGGIIAADSCDSVKLVSAAGAVATDATNAFTAPAAGNLVCKLTVCNVSAGANTITIKHSTNTKTLTGADLALAQYSCVNYISTGAAGFWLQTSAIGTNS